MSDRTVKLLPEFCRLHEIACNAINATTVTALLVGGNPADYDENLKLLIKPAEANVGDETGNDLIAQVTKWDVAAGKRLAGFIAIANLIEKVGEDTRQDGDAQTAV
jgi:hypothetical protein